MIKLLIRVLLISAIPGILFSSYSTSFALLWYDEGEVTTNISSFWNIFFIILGTLSLCLFNFWCQYNRKQSNERVSNQNEILRFNIDLLLIDLSRKLGYRSNKFNVRVFKVKEPLLLNYIGDLWNEGIILKLLHLDKITDPITAKNNQLNFSVKAESIQGVVGVCFSKGTFFADFDTSNANQYVLTEEQRNKIGNVGFCCALPIIKDKKVTHVISLDAVKSINGNIKNINYLKIGLRDMSKLFDKYVLK